MCSQAPEIQGCYWKQQLAEKRVPERGTKYSFLRIKNKKAKLMEYMIRCIEGLCYTFLIKANEVVVLHFFTCDI